MRLVELAGMGRSPALPLQLELNGELLQLETLLRVLPGQRYVGAAMWKGRRVLAKLLVGGKAARHFERERQGAELMACQGLPTPALLESGLVPGQGGWLLFEFLEGASSLWDEWRRVEGEPLLSDGQQRVVGEALELVAHLHARGLVQEDLHLDNILRHDGQLKLIDGGGVRAVCEGEPLPREQVLANLGVFFAQLPATLAPYLEELLVHYLLANGEHALPLEMLEKEIARVRRWRLRDFLEKVGRECSLFSVRRSLFGLRAVRRDAEARVAPLLAAPDAAIAAGHRFKDGGAATVARVEQGGETLLVKRYNIKNLLHWLKRFWRPSRAWHSWREGHRLAFLGIATPRPLAVVEHRWLGLRGRAYLITEYLPGQDIIARFRDAQADAANQGLPPEAELEALDRLFAALIRERISHGDLKGHNLFWQNGHWSLIDLDAVRQHGSERGFARAYARDRERFLRNWPADSALYRHLDERLPKASLKPEA